MSSLAAAQENPTPPVRVGGAIGVNWAYDSCGEDNDPHGRGEKVGNANLDDLDIVRLNANLDCRNVIGSIEYRWFDTYSAVHTAWLGNEGGDRGTFRAGAPRVPFGPAAYDVSSSFFFDQHYYVGLVNDMDL